MHQSIYSFVVVAIPLLVCLILVGGGAYAYFKASAEQRAYCAGIMLVIALFVGVTMFLLPGGVFSEADARAAIGLAR